MYKAEQIISINMNELMSSSCGKQSRKLAGVLADMFWLDRSLSGADCIWKCIAPSRGQNDSAKCMFQVMTY